MKSCKRASSSAPPLAQGDESLPGELAECKRVGEELRQEQARLQATIDSITDGKQAEMAQARLAAIVEGSEDAILSKTLDGPLSRPGMRVRSGCLVTGLKR